MLKIPDTVSQTHSGVSANNFTSSPHSALPPQQQLLKAFRHSQNPFFTLCFPGFDLHPTHMAVAATLTSTNFESILQLSIMGADANVCTREPATDTRL